ncbi:MAG: low molecular weight protein arginine phosphatase [candidate division WOR-3 bacterium]
MSRTVKLKSVKSKDVFKALKKGEVLFPMIGGYCILAFKREELLRRFGHAFRLLPANEILEDFKIFQGKPAVIIAEDEDGFSPAPSPLLNELSNMAPAGLWFSILEPDEEITDKNIVLRVEDDENGPGPTVVNFRFYPPVVEQKGKLGIFELEEIIGKRVRIGPRVIFSILVVCTGNSCRSPIAAALLKEAFKKERVIVTSAGTQAPVGSSPTKFAIEVAQEMGVDVSGHRARLLRPEMVEGADLVLVMEERHKERVVEMVPEAEVKTKFLGGYPDIKREIPDPIGRSIEVYREVGLLMKAGVLRVVAELKERLGKSLAPSEGIPPLADGSVGKTGAEGKGD